MHADMPIALQSTVQRLVRTYSWGLLAEAALCQLVWQAAAAKPGSASWESQVTGAYATLLYQSCGQAADQTDREQAYTELHRYLYYNASQRYPHLSPEDLAQEAIHLVYQQLDHCHTPAAFFTFALFKLLQVAKEAQRRYQRHRNEATLDAASLEIMTVAYSPSPEATIEQQERGRLLGEALARLPDQRQRSVIRLKFFEELSDEAIAKQLELTANHVRVLRNRGLQQLRNQPGLKEYVEATERSV